MRVTESPSHVFFAAAYIQRGAARSIQRSRAAAELTLGRRAAVQATNTYQTYQIYCNMSQQKFEVSVWSLAFVVVVLPASYHHTVSHGARRRDSSPPAPGLPGFTSPCGSAWLGAPSWQRWRRHRDHRGGCPDRQRRRRRLATTRRRQPQAQTALSRTRRRRHLAAPPVSPPATLAPFPPRPALASTRQKVSAGWP